MSAVGDLRGLYARELTARGFSADPAQLAAVARLEALRRRLLRQPKAWLPHWLHAFARRRPDAHVASAALSGLRFLPRRPERA